jgi:hypothetical protein
MIRIDEIYDNVFSPIVLSKPNQSIHYFDPFGRTDSDALQVAPLIIGRDKAFLIWDQEPFYPDVHNDTIDWFLETFINGGIPRSEVVFVTSEQHSTNVNTLCSKHGFSKSYYFFNAWAALDWYRGYNRTHLIPDYKDRVITNTFICKNRVVSGKRKHRVDLFKSLVQNNLIQDNKVSFPATCPYSNEEIHVDGIDLPLMLGGEEPNNVPNESYKISLWKESENSLLDVVTETVYNEWTSHLTEKIFKPIVMQMPFILIGSQYNLEYLKSYGFKTFSDFWSEGYDHQENHNRINTVTKLLTGINDLSLKEKAQLQKHLTPIVEHNFNWFYSKEFEKLLWKELTNMTNKWQ